MLARNNLTVTAVQIASAPAGTGDISPGPEYRCFHSEAANRKAPWKGMQAFAISAARQINATTGRMHGTVFADPQLHRVRAQRLERSASIVLASRAGGPQSRSCSRTTITTGSI